MSNNKFTCIYAWFLFLAIAGLIAALEIDKANRRCNRLVAGPCEAAEACQCQKKQGASNER